MDTGWKSSRKLAQQKDLPQLDAGMEDAGQVLHQLPEVHPLVGGEVEENFAAVKGALGADQLHVQAMGLDLLDADRLGLGLLGPVVGHDALILGRGLAQHLPQGGHHVLLGDAVNAAGADAVFLAPGGVHDHMVPLGQGKPGRVKEIDLLPGPELNIHHGNRFRGVFGEFFHDKLLTVILKDG